LSFYVLHLVHWHLLTSLLYWKRSSILLLLLLLLLWWWWGSRRTTGRCGSILSIRSGRGGNGTEYHLLTRVHVHVGR
jgi:hypothetical protein